MTGAWGLPMQAELGGVRYAIRSDYRDVLELLRGIRLPENLFERVKKREKQRKWNQMKDKKEERMMSVGIERESDG